MRNAIIFLSLIFLANPSIARVNYKNGNFSRSFTVIKNPGGGKDLKINITYNSKATKKGIFGFGFGSNFETYLSPMPDGSVVIYEHGTGAQKRFIPKKKINSRKAAERIVNAMRKKEHLPAKRARELIKKLSNNAELRQSYAQKFNVKARLSSGTVLFSNSRELQKLIVTKDGYKRVYNDNQVQFFNKKGQLVSIKDQYGYTINLNYKNNRLASIKDAQGKQIFFDWYPNGTVKSLASVGDRKTTFKYKDDNLSQIIDVANNTYKFDYDPYHNMTAIKYKDGTQYKIAYEKKTQFTSKTVDRNGKTTLYKYGANSKNPRYHYWTTVITTDNKGKKRTHRYEYEIKKRSDGSEYTYRSVVAINSFKTETIFSDRGLPLKITRGKRITEFAYNSRGLLVKKTTSNGEFIKLEYHKKLNKITKVTNNNGWTKFKYNNKGSLSKAVNSAGKAIILDHDRRGRIGKMISYNKKEGKAKKIVLKFKYNSFGKPVYIHMNKVGSINVTYNNYGEIKKVNSKQGKKMAVQISKAFQSLIEIVAPAGVSLT